MNNDINKRKPESMKTLAVSASNSSVSINAQLVNFVSRQMKTRCDVIDIHDLQIALYSYDEELNQGCPQALTALFNMFTSYDAYIISIPEHNGNFPAFFKNILDWFTRIDRRFFHEKPILLLNASPGQQGGKAVLGIAKTSFEMFGGEIINTLQVTNFNSFLIDGQGRNDQCESQGCDAISNLITMIEHFELRLMNTDVSANLPSEKSRLGKTA